MESLTCQICCIKYNNQDKIPSILSCGHTFCAPCISGFPKQCPNCRKKFEPSRTQRNYALCSLVEEFSSYFNLNTMTPWPFPDICKVHYQRLSQFCKKCSKSMCSLCECPHLKGKEENAVISEVELKEQVENLMKGYIELGQKKQMISKQIDKAAEKITEAIEIHMQFLMKEVKNSAEQLKEDLCSVTDLSKEKTTNFEEYVTMFKKAQEEQESLHGFLNTDFVIRLQAENNFFLSNPRRFESKQILEFLQKNIPVITLSHSKMRKTENLHQANKENCSSFLNVLQALNHNEQDNDVIEISKEQFKQEKEEKKENSPPKEISKPVVENEPPVAMRFKTLSYYKKHAPRFYHNHIQKQDNVFIMPTQYQYKPNLFHDDDEE